MKLVFFKPAIRKKDKNTVLKLNVTINPEFFFGNCHFRSSEGFHVCL